MELTRLSNDQAVTEPLLSTPYELIWGWCLPFQAIDSPARFFCSAQL